VPQAGHGGETKGVGGEVGRGGEGRKTGWNGPTVRHVPTIS